MNTEERAQKTQAAIDEYLLKRDGGLRPRYLHIYAQRFQHEAAEIGGSADALLSLSHAIQRAVETETRRAAQSFYTNDGEGYEVQITVVPDSDIYQIRIPYTDPDCREMQSSKRIYPSELSLVTKLSS